MSTKANTKISLNFFGEIVTVPMPQSLDALRKDISTLFYFSPEDAKEIILTYNENGDILMIENDEDLKTFLNSKITTIDLDISQTSKIYKKNLDNIKEENEQNKKDLEILMKKNEELDKKKETEFLKDKKELEKLRKEMIKLGKKKFEIRKRIKDGMQKINLEKKENNKKIIELQKKLGIPITIKPQPDKLKHKIKKCIIKKKKVLARPLGLNQKPKLQSENMMNHCKFLTPFLKNYIIRTQENEKRDTVDFKNMTMDDWNKCLLNKTKELTTKLINGIKDMPLFFNNDDNINEKKNSRSKEKEEIHNNVRCDGCKMYPLVGKRFKCKKCHNFDYCEKCLEKNKDTHKHEFMLIKKKDKTNLHFRRHHKNLQKNNTTGNLFEEEKKEELKLEGEEKKEELKLEEEKMEELKLEEEEKKEELKLANKIVHFGVKCDGCGAYPIIGCRYKCVICNNFDFCEECEKKKGEEHNHPFMKIYEPKMALLAKKFKGKK